MVDDPAAGLWFLVDTGLAEHFLPELPQMRFEQDPIHRHKDVLAHTIAVVGNVSPRKPDGGSNRITRLAALFHDVGKPKTRSFAKGVGVTFHHHEVVGARMTRDRMQALRYSNEDVEPGHAAGVPAPAVPHATGWGGPTAPCAASCATPRTSSTSSSSSPARDCTTRNERKARTLRKPHGRARGAHRRSSRSRRSSHAIRPDLDGTAVMERLGRAAGPVVGEALAFLLELRLDEGPLDPEEAGRRLDAWWAERSG